jgi:hypothetical protein
MSDIAEQIREEIRAWQKQSGVTISEQALQIIVAAVSAIVYDPHPDWRLPEGIWPWPSKDQGLEEVQQDAIRNLQGILVELASKSPGATNINTFTLLHEASNILDRICPFDKRAF